MAKVLILAQASSIHSCRWAEGLADRGYEILMVSFEDLLPEYQGSKKFRFLNLLKSFGFLSYVSSSSRLKSIIEIEKPNLLHVHYASGYGILGCLSAFHPRITSVWGSDVNDFPERSAFHRKILAKILKTSDLVLATSQALADATVQVAGLSKVEITPFGVDPSLFKPAAKSRTDSAMVLGTAKILSRVYGIDLLLRAFKALSDSLDGDAVKIKLRIAGTGPDEEALKNLARELGINQQVEFLGRLQHKQVPEFLQSLDVFCCLSRSESFGVSVVEASACGLPVVASKVGGLLEVVQDGITGWLVNPEDSKCLVEVLNGNGLVKRPILKKIGQAGVEFVRAKYTWEQSLNQMDGIYRRILNQK